MGTVNRNDIRHQPPVSRTIFSREHYRLSDRGVLTEHCFDLAELNAKTANLDLIVDPAQKLDVAVGQIAG